MSSRFLVGDELGGIKSLRYNPRCTEGDKIELKNALAWSGGKPTSIQLLKHNPDSPNLVAAAYSNGIIMLLRLKDDSLTTVSQWGEHRMKTEDRYVGLNLSTSAVFSCTSNGALKMNFLDGAGQGQSAFLPSRIRAWHLSSDYNTFSYGGDEVDLSLWSTETAFRSELVDPQSTIGKKRKRNDALCPGEIWRARNVPNDSLGLRQPIRITGLTYLSALGSAAQLITGTELGDVRQYDTRAGRRPVSEWNGIGKIGGVKIVKKGLVENELFTADYGCNLSVLDLRNGRVIYTYKGISGAVTSIAPSRGLMLSTSYDRFARIHSVFPPPHEGQRQEKRGDILDKIYVQAVATATTWVGDVVNEPSKLVDDDVDDVWDQMAHAADSFDH